MINFVILICAIFSHALYSKTTKSIYGEDKRKLIINTESNLVYELSRSVALQVSKNKIKKSSQVKQIIDYRPLGDEFNLCHDEPYFDLPTIGDCTGFLIADDLLMTAGHCVNEKYKCSDKVWIFDYNGQAENYGNKWELNFDSENTYSCKEVITYEDSEKNGQYTDYGIIRLDRKVKDRNYLNISKSLFYKNSSTHTMIGHSLGMPKMYVDNLKIEGLLDKKLVNAYGMIDSFSGNSGSPIIDEKNKLVVGILIRGEEDFLYDYNYSCNSIKKCKTEKCAPVTIMKITPEISSKLK